MTTSQHLCQLSVDEIDSHIFWAIATLEHVDWKDITDEDFKRLNKLRDLFINEFNVSEFVKK